jgi:hypothetical protein
MISFGQATKSLTSAVLHFVIHLHVKARAKPLTFDKVIYSVTELNRLTLSRKNPASPENLQDTKMIILCMILR